MRAPRWAYVPLLTAFLTLLGGCLLSLRGSAGGGFIVIGVAVLAFAVLAFIIQKQFLKRAYRAEGMVIDHKKDADGEDAWCPVVRYRLPNGREMTFQSHTSSSGARRSLPVSKRVGVLYDPDHPESAIINRPLEKAGPYAAGLFALAMMAIGVLILAGLLPR